jgi:hypothetical protein
LLDDVANRLFADGVRLNNGQSTLKCFHLCRCLVLGFAENVNWDPGTAI